MKGFVPTPEKTVDLMVARLFKGQPPRRTSRLLDPGCGHGAFIQGVIRWCRRNRAPRPVIVGIELDPEKLRRAKQVLAGESGIALLKGDFLLKNVGTFDYIIGNPPYVAIEQLSDTERNQYRALFESARGRLDLYLLFWERALKLLQPRGRMVFITPEKFAYVETARPLRLLLSHYQIDELLYVSEETFPGLTTYPTVTTVSNKAPDRSTLVRHRNGTRRQVRLPTSGDSWQSVINGSPQIPGEKTLADVSRRISCGVATGADKIFLFRDEDLPVGLARFARPTLAGRELRLGHGLPTPRRVLLIPYDTHGTLLRSDELGPLAEFLNRPEVRKRLEERTCTRRKPWYAFHDSLPLEDMLRPKLLCKDITREPFFWVERRGDVVPLHSTYYIVPRDEQLLEPLANYLNSKQVGEWLRANCQRAASGFLRMQSAVLKKLPVPDALVEPQQLPRRAAA